MSDLRRPKRWWLYWMAGAGIIAWGVFEEPAIRTFLVITACAGVLILVDRLAARRRG